MEYPASIQYKNVHKNLVLTSGYIDDLPIAN